MPYLRNRLRSYVPMMIGLGLIILAVDAIVIILRVIGVEKWTAFYLALLIASLVASVLFNRLRLRDDQELESNTTTGDT